MQAERSDGVGIRADPGCQRAVGAGKEQREAPSLGVQSLSQTKCSWNVTASLSRVQRMGGSAPLPSSAGLLQGKGEQQLSPGGSTAWGCWGARGHQQLSSPRRILPSPSWLPWLLPDAVGSLPCGFSRWTRDGEGDEADGCGEMSQGGQKGPPLMPAAPLAPCSWWGLCRSCSCSPSSRRIRAWPQMPQRGQGSASACPQEARPCPRLSLAWFSLVCFLCHTVQSLGFEGGRGEAVLYKSN